MVSSANRVGGASFQQDAIIAHHGYQYVTYYSRDGYVCIARRELPLGAWETITFTDYLFTSTDGHNVISMGICPNDGTIHLSWDHHVHPLKYRYSVPGLASDPGSAIWSTSQFSPVQDYLEAGKPVTGLTYPAFLQTPDGNMHMIYRVGGSGNGDWIIVDYNGTTHLWSGTRMFISRSGTYTDQYTTSTSRCAYPNYYGYSSDGKLHISWVWREDATVYANHDLMYMYSDDGGYIWYNDKDALVKIISEGSGIESIFSLKSTAADANIIGNSSGKTPDLNSPGVTVININRKYGLINTQAQALDPQSRPHVLMWHCTDQTLAEAVAAGYTNERWGHATARRYHHYWRDDNGVWQHNQLNWISGDRGKLLIAPNGDAYFVYNAPEDPAAMGNETGFADGRLTIAAATQAAGWSDWQIIYTETSFYNKSETPIDPVRFAEDQVIAVYAQEVDAPNPIRIIELQCQ